jgi:hypothetical protein
VRDMGRCPQCGASVVNKIPFVSICFFRETNLFAFTL